MRRSLYHYGVPLIIQDKTFVPQDVATQDSEVGGRLGRVWQSLVPPRL